MFPVLHPRHQKPLLWIRGRRFLPRSAPVATAPVGRATDRVQVPSLHRQQIFILRDLQKKGPGKFWKMVYQEQPCRRGRINSATISGTLWSNSSAHFMALRRRTQDNDRSDCDRNFSTYVCAAFGLVAMAGFPRL